MTDLGLSCRELVELVTDYFDEALPDDERLQFEEHLAACTGCRNYVEQMRTTVETVGKVRENAVSSEARNELLTVFRAWKQSGPVGA